MWIWQRRFNAFIQPQKFYTLARKVYPFTLIMMVIALSFGLWGGLWQSPPDYQQGEGVRIMYIHVPAAMLSMGAFTFMAFASAGFLIWQVKLFDIFAKAMAPIGAALTFIALLTGSLWGKPMWGTWWIWDARLTSELILLFLYLAYLLLNQSLPQTKQGAKACALLAVIGFIDIPIIHYSVQWWQTLHQGATLKLLSKSSIDTSMLIPLLWMIAGLSLLTFNIWVTSVKAQMIDKFKEQTWVKTLLEQS